jgi:hypothetical protein
MPIEVFFCLIPFYATNPNCKIKNIIQLTEPNINFNSTFLYQIKSKNWTIQVIKILNFELLNFFKLQIDTENNFVKLGYKMCQISKIF